jgi:hypothetical protein
MSQLEKKGQTEKAGAVTNASVKKTKSKCSHCGKPGNKEEDCWKKYSHKAPPRHSMEASGMILDEDLLVCHIAQDKMPYVTQGIEEAYYCIPTIEDGQWDDLNNRMGLVDSIVNQEGPLMADPCSEEQMTSNNEKIDDVGMNDWLELQEKVKMHDKQMKELVTSHVEDQQRSVPAETDAGQWGPQKMGPDKQISRKAPSHYGLAHSPKKEYGLAKTRLQPWIC